VRLKTLNFVIILLLCAGCGRSTSVEAVVDPIPLPNVPSEFATDALVVPPELQNEFDSLMAIPRAQWLLVDVDSLVGNERRAATYWQFFRRDSSSVTFWLELHAGDRKRAEQFEKRLAAGWSLEPIQSYYLAAKERQYYWVFRKQTPSWTRSQLAWLCDWLSLNFPEDVAGCSPEYVSSHSEGAGLDI
jgi:hypothetical protein